MADGRTGGEPVTGVAIYMEGGGRGSGTKAALRRGMDTLLGPLKQAARNKSMRWKLVCCGPRDVAFRSFRNAARNGEAAIVLLLVDAEGPVATGPCEHLQARDGWDMIDVDAQSVHMMVQTMEAWIVADGDALRGYYGQSFNAGAVPRATDRANDRWRAWPRVRSRVRCAGRQNTRGRGRTTRSPTRATCCSGSMPRR